MFTLVKCYVRWEISFSIYSTYCYVLVCVCYLRKNVKQTCQKREKTYTQSVLKTNANCLSRKCPLESRLYLKDYRIIPDTYTQCVHIPLF